MSEVGCQLPKPEESVKYLPTFADPLVTEECAVPQFKTSVKGAEYVKTLDDPVEDDGFPGVGTVPLKANVQVPLSQFVNRMIFWDYRKSMRMDRRPWLKDIYNVEYTSNKLNIFGEKVAFRQVLLLTSRQTEKSTLLGNKLLAYLALIPGINLLYVSSAGLNMHEFAEKRIHNPIRVSPYLKQWMGSIITNNKLEQRWANYSRLVMRSAYLTAGRVRGISADGIFIDELQDMLAEHLPIITACANNTQLPYGRIITYSGTPLSYDNIIERIWSKNSTMSVWLTRCTRCNLWNPPYVAQIGKFGMICSKCGKALDPIKNGQWVRQRTNVDKVDYAGFHLSRVLMAYTVVHDEALFRSRWRMLLSDMNDPTVDDSQKMNEHIGLSYDSGRKPITRKELIRCSDPNLKMSRLLPKVVRTNDLWYRFMGIDWGEGSGSSAYTVVTMGYYDHSTFVVSYAHRYTGSEARDSFIIKDITELMTVNRINLAVCDAGHGWGIVPAIREKLTDGMQRLIAMRYGPTSNTLSMDSKKNQLVADRTQWMSKIFAIMKRGNNPGGLRLPRWTEFEDPYGTDIMSISSDKSPRLKKMTYRRRGTDDTFHSILYLLTAKIVTYNEYGDVLNS